MPPPLPPVVPPPTVMRYQAVSLLVVPLLGSNARFVAPTAVTLGSLAGCAGDSDAEAL